MEVPYSIPVAPVDDEDNHDGCSGDDGVRDVLDMAVVTGSLVVALVVLVVVLLVVRLMVIVTCGHS